MDDPDHRVVRAIGADRFRPKATRMLESRVRGLAREYVDQMASLGGECDFATDVPVHYPLYVMLAAVPAPENNSAGRTGELLSSAHRLGEGPGRAGRRSRRVAR